MKIGYARVSTEDQNLEMQLDGLTREGCEKIFMEKVSGEKTENRPELLQLLQYARQGDTVVVYKIDRLSRKLRDLVIMIDTFQQKGINFKSLSEGIDTSTPMGKAMFGIIAVFAELERENIKARTRDGLAAAKERGRLGGRPKGLTPEKTAKAALVQTLTKEGRYSVSEICKKAKVTKSSYYRYLNTKL